MAILIPCHLPPAAWLECLESCSSYNHGIHVLLPHNCNNILVFWDETRTQSAQKEDDGSWVLLSVFVGPQIGEMTRIGRVRLVGSWFLIRDLSQRFARCYETLQTTTVVWVSEFHRSIQGAGTESCLLSAVVLLILQLFEAIKTWFSSRISPKYLERPKLLSFPFGCKCVVRQIIKESSFIILPRIRSV